jgi:predicted nucleic acid-binding protein
MTIKRAYWVMEFEKQTKGEKMFEEEAKELLKKYEEELEDILRMKDVAEETLYHYTSRFNEIYKEMISLKHKILLLKTKMDGSKEDENE